MAMLSPFRRLWDILWTPQGHIILWCLGSSVLTAFSTITLQRFRRLSKGRRKKASILETEHEEVDIGDWGGPANVVEDSQGSREFSEELIREQLARNYAFFGEEGMSNIRRAFVVVAGAGGVGSWALTMLVTLSGLNRHAVATLSDVGRSKTAVLVDKMKEVAPWVTIEVHNTLLNIDNIQQLLEGSPNYVIDAIDNLTTKVDLLEYCHSHQIPVISSMGSGCKSDPSRIHIGDISATIEDPLSRSTRRRLRAKGVSHGIPVVFSSEKPDPRKASLLPLDQDIFEKGNANEYGVLPDFRARILPVLGPMPGIAGLNCATYVLTELAGYPNEPLAHKYRLKFYNDIVSLLSAQNTRLEESAYAMDITVTTANAVSVHPVDADDVGFVVDEIYRGKSVLPPHNFTRATLTRWEREKGSSLPNLVCMTKVEAKAHEAKVLIPRKRPEEVYPEHVISLVKQRQQELRDLSKWR